MSAEEVRGLLDDALAVLDPLTVNEALNAAYDDGARAPITEAVTCIRAALASLVPAVPSEGLTEADREIQQAGFHGYVGCPQRECPSPFLCSERGDCRLAASVPAVGPGEQPFVKLSERVPEGWKVEWGFDVVDAEHGVARPILVPLTPPEDSPDAPEEASTNGRSEVES